MMCLNQFILQLNIQNSCGKGWGWIIDSVIDHTVNISKCNSLASSSYVKVPKELDHSKKALLIFKISMIMNALNDVWLDSYTLKINQEG